MVTAEIARTAGNAAAITFRKGDEGWSTPSSFAAVDLGGTAWAEVARQDAATPTERIVAYTNIEAVEPKPFHEVKGAAPYTVMAGDTVVPEAGLTGLPDGERQSVTLVDDPETDQNDRTFGGSLDGADGDFTCTVDPCTLRRLADVGGSPVWALMGGWTFTADDGDDGRTEVPDADYLAFGYWNMIDIDSLTDVAPFYYGSMPYYTGNVQALSGSATYNGHAAGGYEHETYDGGTGKATSTFGHFTAAVRLNAFFGGEDGMSTIDGMVNSFALLNSEGTAPSPDLTNVDDWEVMLDRTEVTGQNFMGTTNGGNWNGAFFGPSVDDMGKPLYPSGVAGGFNAVFDNGAVKGAYGATTTQQ